MKLFKNFRSKIFWGVDRIAGGKLHKNLKEIGFILENYSDPRVAEGREKYLASILKHAVTTTPFYQRFQDFRSLSDFPVIHKNIIRDHFDRFRSTAFAGKRLVPVVTSGSTGTPFRIFWDKNKKLRNTADTLYFSGRAGYRVGDRLIYMKIWSRLNRKTPLTLWMQNIWPLDVFRLSDRRIAGFIEKLRKEKSSVNFLGYASAFEALCRYLEKAGAPTIPYRTNSAIAISEALDEHAQAAMAKYFNIFPVSRYSNIENGILAQQCGKGGHGEFHINSASYFVEILDMAKDIPAPPGTPGRIVVTDLFNHAMPMIRYDTGDVGIMGEGAACDFKTPVLMRIEGRKLDLIYDTLGRQVSSYLVYRNMWKYTELKQYQLIQNDRKAYLLKLNPVSRFSREQELVAEFKSYLGNNAVIDVEYVDEIPLLASGKRRMIVNHYHEQELGQNEQTRKGQDV